MGLHSLRADDALWSAALAKARSEGRTLTDMITHWLRAYTGTSETALGVTIQPDVRMPAGVAVVVPHIDFAEPTGDPLVATRHGYRPAPRARCPHPGLPRSAGGFCKGCDVILEPGGYLPR